jgi:hypothetical protein
VFVLHLFRSVRKQCTHSSFGGLSLPTVVHFSDDSGYCLACNIVD